MRSPVAEIEKRVWIRPRHAYGIATADIIYGTVCISVNKNCDTYFRQAGGWLYFAGSLCAFLLWVMRMIVCSNVIWAFGWCLSIIYIAYMHTHKGLQYSFAHRQLTRSYVRFKCRVVGAFSPFFFNSVVLDTLSGHWLLTSCYSAYCLRSLQQGHPPSALTES